MVVGDLVAESAHAVAERIAAAGGEAIAVAFDQSDDASVKALIDAGVRRFGKLDFLHADAADMSMITQRRRCHHGAARGVRPHDRGQSARLPARTRYALPHLVEAKGVIVYTSSAAAFAGSPQRVAYAMLKAAVNALMRHVASRWGREGVRANAIAPGFVYTEQTRNKLPPEIERSVLRQLRSSPDRRGETT